MTLSPELSPALLPERLLDLLDHAGRVFAMVDFVFYALPPGAQDTEALHRQAALTAMWDFTSWADEVKHLWPPEVSREWPVVRPDRMKSEVIQPWQLWGRLPGQPFPAEFEYAFMKPPYGLRGDPQENAGVCRAIFDALTQGATTVRRWSTDWSSYFDAGLEGWGAFYWTVFNPAGGWVAVVGASTTD